MNYEEAARRHEDELDAILARMERTYHWVQMFTVISALLIGLLIGLMIG